MSKVIVFHGADHKVGTTMIAQSTAELLSRSDNKVIYLGLNARASTDYLHRDIESIDYIKDRIDSEVLTPSDLLSLSTEVNGYYALGGICDESNQRGYMPKTAEILINIAKQQFDILIVDAGNELDNGLALGALQAGDENVFLLTQRETALSRWEKRKFLYDKLDIKFSLYIINKYEEKDLYSKNYIIKRIKLNSDQALSINKSGSGEIAEIEHKSMVELQDDLFTNDMKVLISALGFGSVELKKEKKKKWRNFI